MTSKRKLGVLVSDLGASQQNYYLIKNANDLVGNRSDTDVVAFYESLSHPCMAMNFASMQLAECWSFDGVAVATTFSTAEKLIRFPGPRKRAFYCWDIEWLREKRMFRDAQSVYGRPELILLARCKDHAEVISDVWCREVTVVEDFNLEEIFGVVR